MLSSFKGDTGIVRTAWCDPFDAVEVAFRPAGQPFETRCMAARRVALRPEPRADA